MAQFHVDSEAVHSATSMIRSTIGSVQSELARLHSHLTALEGSWSGQAAASFQAAVADWRSTQLRVEESLGGISLALSRAGEHYREVEQANSLLFSR